MAGGDRSRRFSHNLRRESFLARNSVKSPDSDKENQANSKIFAYLDAARRQLYFKPPGPVWRAQMRLRGPLGTPVVAGFRRIRARRFRDRLLEQAGQCLRLLRETCPDP
jgi:hypothetical protein